MSRHAFASSPYRLVRAGFMAALVCVSLWVLASCGGGSSTPAAKPDDTSASVTEQRIAAADSTAQRFSDALAACDTATVDTLASDHFASVEDAKVHDLATTVAALAAAKSEGQLTRTMGKLSTRLKGRIAWTHYHVKCEWTPVHGKPTSFTRVETLVLQRRDDGWQIELMTSALKPSEE